MNTQTRILAPLVLPIVVCASALVLAGCTDTKKADHSNAADHAKKPAASAEAKSESPAAAAPVGKEMTTASGLKYEILKAGTGKTPGPKNTVTVHYAGTLTDGTEFDSSYKRGAPATFPVGGVIKGWTEALQMMKEGAKWKLTIPPNLAYGARSVGKIPANSTLVFDVELISVN